MFPKNVTRCQFDSREIISQNKELVFLIKKGSFGNVKLAFPNNLARSYCEAINFIKLTKNPAFGWKTTRFVTLHESLVGLRVTRKLHFEPFSFEDLFFFSSAQRRRQNR